MSEVVLSNVDQRGVATLMLNRPQVNNAYDGDLLAALHSALQHALDDPAVRVICLQGAGRHFQAGADLKWLCQVAALSPEENLSASRQTADLLHRLNEAAKPTLALVQGGCFGGGVGIAAACDIVIAGEDAKFSIAEARWGMTAGLLAPLLNATIGVRQARRYALTGERFDAERALKIGLVHEICAPGRQKEAAEPIIEALLMGAPGSLVDVKQALRRTSLAHDDEAARARLIREHAEKRQSAEAREGLASFVEKRLPKWCAGRS